MPDVQSLLLTTLRRQMSRHCTMRALSTAQLHGLRQSNFLFDPTSLFHRLLAEQDRDFLFPKQGIGCCAKHKVIGA